MNKKCKALDFCTIGNSISDLDRLTLRAQMQWEKDGSVPVEYLEQALGDISKGLVVLPAINKQNRNK
jgi:hypothetical protein